MNNNKNKKKKNKKLSNFIITSAIILAFLIGISVMLYPMVSNYINSKNQSRAIDQYNEALSRLSEKDYSALIAAANEYNTRLYEKATLSGNSKNRFSFTDEEETEYYKILDFTGTGIIGTLEIDILNINLPIYLGTKESVLQVGIGHLEGSSLPIGGPGTHSVISGHRGLPSSTLLTHADRLREGDVFKLKVLNEVLYYEIDQIRRVEPNDFDYLGIYPGIDYCTLLTCTPVGVNSHRLLLRGIRIYPNEASATDLPKMRVPTEEASEINIIAQYAISAIPIVIILSIVILVRKIIIKINKSKNKTKTK